MLKLISDVVDEYLKHVSSHKNSFKKEKIWFNDLLRYCSQQKIKNISEFKPKDADFLQNGLSKLKKASSVNRQFTTYCHFFNKCVEWEYIQDTPMKFLKKKKETDPVRLLWTEKDINDFLKVCPAWFKNCFLFLALTGARPIELCNLKVSDVFIENETLRLSCEKNAKGSRLVPVSQPVVKLIQKLIYKRGPSEFVFCGATGCKLKTAHLTRTLKRIQIAYKLKRIPLYSLRHTYATDLCRRDINIEKVRILLGHSQIRTTQKYIQVDFLDLKKIVNGG